MLAVLWPLARARRGVSRRDSDISFFKAQSDEIDRDVERGLLSPEDARSAKAEAARRLLASQTSEAETSSIGRNARWGAALALVLVPGVALGLYGFLGSPDFPDQPLEARLGASPDRMDIMAAVAQIERHLSQNPDDLRGYEILAPVYMRIGRAADSAKAWRNAIRIAGASPERLEAFGEALSVAANGKVTAEAEQAFAAAAAVAPEMPQPQFFLGLAAEQRGDAARARDIWTKLLDKVPPGLDWTEMVRQRLDNLPGSGPTNETGRSIAALPPAERQAAIRTMVEGLAARLAEKGDDLEGWLRLVRAYSVLQEKDRATAALAEARRNFSTDSSALGRLDELARELGLGT